MRSTPNDTLVRLPNGRMEWHLADGRTAPFIFGSDGDDPAPEPQSVADAAGTLSQVAREAAEAPAAEPVEAPANNPDDIEPELLDDLDEPAIEDPAEDPVAGDDPQTPADPFAEFGGKDTVQAALRLHEATKTEDGIIQLFLEAGKQLGVGLDKIEALFTGQQAPSAPAAGDADYDPDTDPDRPLTVREFQELSAKQQQEYRASQQQAQAQQARTAATTVVQDTVKGLGLSMEDDAAQVILQLGNKYLPEGSLEPDAIKAAVERGHADYLALVEKERKAYVASKRKAATDVPSAPAGGAAPSAAEPAEPADTAEAIKRARAMFKDKGVLR